MWSEHFSFLPLLIAATLTLQTACRDIDTYHIATARLASHILVSTNKVTADNAKKYGIEAHYIPGTNDYNKYQKSQNNILNHILI